MNGEDRMGCHNTNTPKGVFDTFGRSTPGGSRHLNGIFHTLVGWGTRNHLRLENRNTRNMILSSCDTDVTDKTHSVVIEHWQKARCQAMHMVPHTPTAPPRPAPRHPTPPRPTPSNRPNSNARMRGRRILLPPQSLPPHGLATAPASDVL